MPAKKISEVKPRPAKRDARKHETADERRLRMRRERHAAYRADELAAKAASQEAEGAANLTLATATTQAQARGAIAGKKSPSTITKARDNLTAAFDLMGGVPALVRWGRLNPTEFYRIWARLIPKEAADASAQTPLEDLLAQLATKSEKSVAEAAYEIGQETLLAAKREVSIEDARAELESLQTTRLQ
jgi:hypothetical protein